MKLLFTADWLRRKIESDPDLPCEAGPEIGYVPQRLDYDCGVAALAMVTGTPYDTIFADLESCLTPNEGINDLHVHDWAIRRGWAVQLMYQNHPKAGRYVKRDPWPPQPFAPSHLVQVIATRGAHFCVMDAKGEIFDPWKAERKTLTHPDYQNVGWVMGFWPVAPE